MSKISVYIIAYNQERKISRAIKSVIDWADEVIVADSFSTDNTVTIAESLGAKVVQIPFNGFGNLRNSALSHCQYPWIYSLDSDERCMPAAQEEILSIIKKNAKEGPVAYLVPRKNYLLGRWVKHSGWYPNYRQPQLFRKGKFEYTKELVHEGYIAHGKVSKLTQPIIQFPFENLAEMLHKANRYSTLGAEKLKETKKGGFGVALGHAMAIFFRNYFFRLGFLDGRAGFVIALGNFIATYYKYAKLVELHHKWGAPDEC